MPNEWQTSNRHDEREQVARARQAAEELFKPKPTPTHAATMTPQPGAATSGTEQAPRKPRIIAIPAMVPMADHREEPQAAPLPTPRKASARPRGARIPKSQYGRVQALASYGMTVGEVAELYGVAESEVERVIAKA